MISSWNNLIYNYVIFKIVKIIHLPFSSAEVKGANLIGLSTKLALELSVPHAVFSDGQQQNRHLQQRTFRNCEHEQLFPITQK